MGEKTIRFHSDSIIDTRKKFTLGDIQLLSSQEITKISIPPPPLFPLVKARSKLYINPTPSHSHPPPPQLPNS